MHPTARLFHDNHEIRAALRKKARGSSVRAFVVMFAGKTRKDRLRHRQHRNLERGDVHCREIMRHR